MGVDNFRLKLPKIKGKVAFLRGGMILGYPPKVLYNNNVGEIESIDEDDNHAFKAHIAGILASEPI